MHTFLKVSYYQGNSFVFTLLSMLQSSMSYYGPFIIKLLLYFLVSKSFDYVTEILINFPPEYEELTVLIFC